MSVSPKCQNNVSIQICDVAQDIFERTRVATFGGKTCCNTNSKDLRWYLATYLLDNYGNKKGGVPGPQVYLSDKMVECICTWAQRQFPN